MTYETWARQKKWAEGGAVLERDPEAYFAAVDLLDRLERILNRG